MGLVHPQDYVSCGKDRLHFRLITGRISMQQFQRLKRFIRNISEESLVLFLAGGVVEGHGGEAEEGRGGGGQWGEGSGGFKWAKWSYSGCCLFSGFLPPGLWDSWDS